MSVAVALKRVALRVRADPLTGTLTDEPHAYGLSAADRAALEWALRLGEAWSAPVVAVSAGPPAAEEVLREALAAGAARALRVDLPAEVASETIGRALAAAVPDAQVWCCGDVSLDRGSGSVPAYLAHAREAAQALGLVEVRPGRPGELAAARRLDGGRRERLTLRAPCVISVESATARLRRAPLGAAVAAAHAAVPTLPAAGPVLSAPVGVIGPYRPPARGLPAPDPALPARERVLALTAQLAASAPARLLTLDPDAAAEELLAYLRENGYLP